MWYKDVFSKLNKENEYTRKQIYDALAKEKPELTYNSFNWIASKMIEDGMIFRKQYDKYVLNDSKIAQKNLYVPLMSEKLKAISKKIERKFPLIDFVCFESMQLNEFLNHLIGKNMYFILVEKDAVDYVFRYLQEETNLNVLLKPNVKEWDAYCTEESVVVLNLISEAPKILNEYHGISLEQLLVDIIAEKSFMHLYSKSEIQEIYNHAEKSYLIDYARLLRYARRRGKADIAKEYIGGFESVNKK